MVALRRTSYSTGTSILRTALWLALSSRWQVCTPDTPSTHDLCTDVPLLMLLITCYSSGLPAPDMRIDH